MTTDLDTLRPSSEPSDACDGGTRAPSPVAGLARRRVMTCLALAVVGCSESPATEPADAQTAADTGVLPADSAAVDSAAADGDLDSGVGSADTGGDTLVGDGPPDSAKDSAGDAPLDAPPDVSPGIDAGPCVPSDSGAPAPSCAGALFCANGTVDVASSSTKIACSDHVSALWAVTSGTPDYTYKFGAGASLDRSFSLAFPSAPPPEALNSGAGIAPFGVAYLALLGPAPDGKLDKSASLRGVSRSHVVVFKSAGATFPTWIGLFPDGYSCGVETPKPPGSSFVGFKPVPCSEAVITVGNTKVPNWT